MVKIGSFNCRGLSSNSLKRRDIFNWIQQKQLDICVLLETHSENNKHAKWKAEWGGPAWFSSYKSNSRGVAILFKNSFTYVIHEVKYDTGGRFVLIDITLSGKRMTIVGLYGPNEDDQSFIENLKQKIINTGNQSIIMCGDWNAVLDYRKDCKNYKANNNPKMNKAIHELMAYFNLEDVWRNQNPNNPIYSWFGPNNKMGRLDYFLVSSDLAIHVDNTGYDTGYRSDHSLCYITINCTEQKRGKGTWKFNNSLLFDHDYVRLVKQNIQEVIDQYKVTQHVPNEDNEVIDPLLTQFTISDQMLFEMLKLKIRGNTIEYSSRKKKERNAHEQKLMKNLENMNKKIMNNPLVNLSHEKKRLENELEIIREERIKGLIVRSKAKWIKEGEKCTKYFCSLEKQNTVDKSIEKVTLTNGTVLKDKNEILNAQREFYKKLYTTENRKLSENTEKMFFDDNNPFITKLSEEEASSCEGELSIFECHKALKAMANEKSPGSDGFTTEFYKFFWNDLKIYLLRSLNESYRDGKLSVTQRNGLITCIPKPEKPRDQLKSWRPITLLNVDLKIASASIANRLKTHLNKIISETQKGYVKGRYIGECTRLIYDILYESKKNNKQGLLLLVDFQKAFDSLEIPFLQRALRFFGLKNDFCNWVNLFYTDINSSITNNGHISEQFEITRGVRQGDPLSPYLFLIAVECLSAAIKFHPKINGINVDGSEYLITQLADDTTLMLDGTEESLNNCLDVFDKFHECSGLQVNIDKTQAIWIGSETNSKKKLLTDRNLDWNTNGKFKLLGITFNLRDDNLITENYNNCLQSIVNLLNNWKWRPLSVIGRITVVKTLALSKLVHLFMSLPNPSNNFFKQLETIIFNFIWNGKKDKIKRKIIINELEEGGLNMTHLMSFCNSLKLIWIKKLLDIEIISSWKLLFLSITEKHGINIIWLGNCYNKCNITKIINPFWNEILKIWSKLPRSDPQTIEDILSEPIWYNEKIITNNIPLFKRSLHEKNINYINDLIKENGLIHSHQSFQEQFGICINFIEYGGLLNSIPQNWKIEINRSKKRLIRPNRDKYVEKIMKENKPSKVFYKILLSSNSEQPIEVQNKWKEEIPEIDKDLWTNYFLLAKKSTTDTRIQYFQYKVLLRILTTNSKLFQYKMRANDLCTFCNEHQESIIHLLWECTYSQEVWKKSIDWILNKTGIHIVLNRLNIIVGIVEQKASINCLILWGKYYLFCCKCKEKKPKYEELKEIIKKYIRIDQMGQKNNLQNKWENFLCLY